MGSNLIRHTRYRRVCLFLWYLSVFSYYNSVMKTYGVVLAAGSGTRMRNPGGLPKQLLEVAGKTIIRRAVEGFAIHPEVDEIIVVGSSDYGDAIRAEVFDDDLGKSIRYVDGGVTRTDSVVCGLDAISEADAWVLVHDGARPFVSGRVISDVIDCLGRVNAVDILVDSTDTLVRVDSGDVITGVLDRDIVKRAQTPQGFSVATLRRAFALAREDVCFRDTDEISVVFKYLPEEMIAVVRGEAENIKITEPFDLLVAEVIARNRV